MPTPAACHAFLQAAKPMVEDLLRRLRQLPGLEGPLPARILDDGDAVAAWEGKGLAAVLFPTAETLGEVRRIAEARRWARQVSWAWEAGLVEGWGWRSSPEPRP